MSVSDVDFNKNEKYMVIVVDNEIKYWETALVTVELKMNNNGRLLDCFIVG